MLLRRSGVSAHEGDVLRYDMKQMIKWEELLVKKSSRHVANSEHAGREVNLKCRGHRRHVEFTGRWSLP